MKTPLAALSVFAAVAALTAAVPASAQLVHDPAQVKGGDFEFDPNHSKISFSYLHMGYSIYQGQFTGVTGKLHLDPAKLGASTLDAEFPVAGVVMGNPKLDEDVKSPNLLDAAQFATVSFHATRIERTGPKTARVTGDLKMHGVTHPASFDAEFIAAGPNPFNKVYRIGFSGHGSLKRSDWGVTKFLGSAASGGVAVAGDELQLVIEAELKQVQ